MSQMTPPKSTWLLWLAAGAMLVIHQDFWFWDNDFLMFGFLPVGLAYQAAYSVSAACLWAWAIKYVWPAHVEAMAED